MASEDNDSRWTIGQKDLAVVLDLTSRSIVNLREKGMPWLGVESVPNGKPQYDLRAAVKWYVRYKEDLARPDAKGEADIRKARAQARLAELEVAEREKSLVPIEQFEEVMGEIMSEVRARLLNLPSAVSVEVAATGDPIEARELLVREVDSALESIVQYGANLGDYDPVLEEDFPYLDLLHAADIRTYGQLATFQDLTLIPGIGPKRADAIRMAQAEMAA